MESLLIIDDPHVEALAAQVAELTGLPIEDAVSEALELQVARLSTGDASVTPG